MLYGWMKTLIVYLIFSGAIINMSPSGNYKRYINLFTGLIVIVILSNPISYIFNLKSADVDILAKSVGKYMEYNQQLESYGEIYDYYDISISEAIRISLEEKGYTIEKVEVITNGELLVSCRIYCNRKSNCSTEDNTNIEINIKNYVSQVYNVDFDSIYIVRR